MAKVTVWFLIAIRCCRMAVALQCARNAISLPLMDVVVDASVSNSTVRGIPAKVGNPEQRMVLLPWAELNNSYFYDSSVPCDPTVISSTSECRIRRGGVFAEDSSSSWRLTADILAAGGATQETTNPSAEIGIPSLISNSIGGTDSITLGSLSKIDGFPIGIPRQKWDGGYSILSALGLGQNSTYLNTLYRTGQIGSRVWSLFYGRLWTNNPIDGSLVLGGYDQQLMLGQNYTRPLNYEGRCMTGLKMNVLSIVLNFKNGSNVPLTNQELWGCIVPTRQNFISMIAGRQLDFERLTNTSSIGDSYGMHWEARMYNAKAAYDGDMTISLDNGLTVRVENHNFMTPHVDYDNSGSRTISQNVTELLMNRLGEDTITLGRYFLSAAYLTVDYDANTFTLSSANPTSASKLVPITNKEMQSICANGTSGPSQSPGKSAPTSKGLSTGAIVGIAVAGIAVLILLAVAVFFIRRRKRALAGTTNTWQPGPASPLQESSDKSKIFVEQQHYPYTQQQYSQVQQHHPHTQYNPVELSDSQLPRAQNVYELPVRRS